MKDKNHMIISIDAENAFHKIQHTFMIKPLSKVGLERTYLNIIKATYYKPLQAHTQCAKTTSIPLKIGNKIGKSTLTSLIQHSSRSHSHSS